MKIGVIGGSGFYDFLEDAIPIEIITPFGKTSFEKGNIGDHDVYFIPRHGSSHSIPPSAINYQANIFAAHLCGIDMLFSTNAVGSLHNEISIGTLVIPDQLLDFTSGREYTFFDGNNLVVELKSGDILQGVVHVDVTDPFNGIARDNLIGACEGLNENYQVGGTIAVTNGPRFETRAEIIAYRQLGATVIGMTSSPEVFLANELRIPYATLAVVTNYASGMQESVSAQEVFDLFEKRLVSVKNVIKRCILGIE